MIDQDTALPADATQATEASGQLDPAAPTDNNAEGESASDGKADEKPQKTPEERERQRMQRGIDRKTRQAAEARAEAAQLRAELERLRAGSIGDTNRKQQDDSEPVSLSRSELARLVKEEAAKLAPTIKQQEAEIEHRTGVIQTLAKTWGQEKFDALAAELDETFGGLADASGRPKPATDAIFEADDPAAVIEFLADPDNADKAEAIARMGAVQAGRAIAKLEAEIAAKKAESKPRASKAPAPIEAGKAAGTAPNGYHPNMTDAQYAAWRKTQRSR